MLRFGRSLRIFAVLLVKDEEDVIGYQIEYLIEQGVSHILLADNLSSDNTRAIAKGYSSRFPITIIEDNEFAYYQAKKMNKFVSLAYSLGADFILPIDADEIWYSIDKSLTLGETINKNSSRSTIFEGQRRNFIPSLMDGNEKNPFSRIKHIDATTRVGPKVGFTRDKRAHLIQGNHDVLNHKGSRIGGVIAINHFPYRSFEQFKQKLRNGRAVYESTDLSEDLGRHWRTLGSLSDEDIAKKWNEILNTPTINHK
jgi:glycosyltransferase involved in cell wall biosynthesis